MQTEKERVLIYIVLALLIFSVLIFIHELGHYIFARLFKVSIKEFSIGMGPKLVSKVSKKTGIAYSIRILPIGGFVSMVGEDEESEDENALNRKPVWQRMIITAAGAAMNLLLGILLTCIIVVSSKTLGSTTILRFADENSVSQESGLRVGDKIVKIGDANTHISYDLVFEIMREGIEPIDVTVIRGGKKLVVEDVVFPTVSEQGTMFGDADFYVAAEEKNFVNVVKHSWYQSCASIKLIWTSLIDLITGRYGIEQMSGPVGMTSAIGDAAKSGFGSLLSLTALITLNLGIFNIIPLPALDGGRLVFMVIELIRGKPIKPEYEGYVHFAGIVLFMALMVFVTYKDLMRLFLK
ncbi:MAG: M50 family metallopeptidase [Firmicutes bacterium]|nr:M50 family metallopeptidase [Bacillota bacterium]